MNRCAQLFAFALLLLLQSGAGIAHAQRSPSAQNMGQEERTLLAAAKREPENAQMVGSLGEYYLHAGKWQQSVPWLKRAYALSPGDDAIGYDLAYADMQAGELDGAKNQIEQMLKRTDTARLHSLLGAVDDRRGSYLDAAREYHRAAEIDPSESNIFDLATYLVQHKNYVGFLDESIKFFRYGVAQFPRSSKMMVGLGVALYASQQYDEAVQTLCAAVDLNPKDPRAIEFLGRARRVSPALSDEVDRRLEDFARRYPENAATNYYYALSLWERGGGEEGRNPDQIERLLRKAEALSPGWYEPHYQLGVLYEAEKRYPEAIREMRDAVKIDEAFYPAHFRLAGLYNRIGERSKAAAEALEVKRLKDQDRELETVHDVTH